MFSSSLVKVEKEKQTFSSALLKRAGNLGLKYLKLKTKYS